MPQPNGLQLAGQLPNGCFPVVVFVTAYDEFALQAFEVNAIDYLLKPFDQERFDKAFRRAVEQVALRHHYSSGQLIQKYQALASLSPSGAPLEVLLVKDGGKTQLIRVTELTHLEAEGNYVALHTPSGKYLLHETLSALETVLNPRLFCRVHRSIIVQVTVIKEIRSHFNGDYTLLLNTGKQVRLSRNFKQHLKTLIGNF
jgi:two-component system LytT family response regulator